MEFILAILVFGGLLAICYMGFSQSARSAGGMNTTASFGRPFSEPKPYNTSEPKPYTADPAPSQPAPASTMGEDHPVLQAGSEPSAPRPVRDKSPKVN